MKMTLTTYSKDGRFKDVKLAEIGVNCPYAIKIEVLRFMFTIYRWSCPMICISMAKSFPVKVGAWEDWHGWVLWLDKPWHRLHFWRRD
jgi:hypothetical protein